MKHLHNRPGWWRSSTTGRSECAGAAELLLRCAGSSLGRNVREEAEGRALNLTRIRTRGCVPAGGVHAVGACCCTSRPPPLLPVILVRVPVVRSRLARPTCSRPADAPLAAPRLPQVRTSPPSFCTRGEECEQKLYTDTPPPPHTHTHVRTHSPSVCSLGKSLFTTFRQKRSFWPLEAKPSRNDTLQSCLHRHNMAAHVLDTTSKLKLGGLTAFLCFS